MVRKHDQRYCSKDSQKAIKPFGVISIA